MKTLKYLLLATGLFLGFTANARAADEATEISFEPDYFEALPFIVNEEASAPEREGPLAPLLKILNDNWIFVTDGKPSSQWASGEIAQRGAKSVLESLDQLVGTAEKYERISSNDEAREIRVKLEQARETVKNGLAFSSPHRYSPALHSSIVSAKDILSRLEIKTPALAESLFMASFIAELNFFNTLREITLHDLKAPPAREGERLSQKTAKTFDHAYAAARLLKIKIILSFDLNRRSAKIYSQYASDTVRHLLSRTNQQIKSAMAQLKIELAKALAALKAQAKHGDEKARDLFTELSFGRSGAPKQCRALFKD